MPSYDQARFSPPAPCADVMLKDISTGKTVPQVSWGRFLLTDDGWGVLGRDVINLVAILLDGPREAWSESAPAAG